MNFVERFPLQNCCANTMNNDTRHLAPLHHLYRRTSAAASQSARAASISLPCSSISFSFVSDFCMPDRDCTPSKQLQLPRRVPLFFSPRNLVTICACSPSIRGGMSQCLEQTPRFRLERSQGRYVSDSSTLRSVNLRCVNLELSFLILGFLASKAM